MNAATAAAVAGRADRYRRLRALGVTPCVLRIAPATSAPAVAAASAATPASRCVLVLPRDGMREPRQRAQVEALLAAVGLHGDAVRWLAVDEDRLEGEPPAATAYLALGHHATRALGMALPSALRDAAVVAVTASAPADWLLRPGERRAAWQALRPLRLALRRAG